MEERSEFESHRLAIRSEFLTGWVRFLVLASVHEIEEFPA